MPDVQSEFNLQLEESFESGSIQQHQVLAESDSTKSIVHCVMAAKSEQLKTTIAEHVSISVKSMANSVADIITESLNDRMTALETENKTLKVQINKLTVKVQELETHKRQTDQCITLLSSTPVDLAYGSRAYLNLMTNVQMM